MASFSENSLVKLESCHVDLKTVMIEVIKHFDCTIIYGHRTPKEQLELYKQGREKEGVIVTYKDGYKNLSKHNAYPSNAVDVVPYPIDWKDTERMNYFAGFVMAIAKIFKSKGIIDNDIVWGGDWNNDTKTKEERFSDRPHFEIR